MPRWLTLLSPLLLAACSAPAQLPTSTPSPTLRPRSVATQMPSPTPPKVSTPVATAGPTPTPLIHVVKQGETLLGIAITYGVELPDLLLANPDVNPRFLSVGSGLIIPSTGAQSAVATATPQPLTLTPARCYPGLSGGVWCLLLASTDGSRPLEAVIALVTLVSADGEALRTEPAYSPINLLSPDSVLPLAAYFAPPVPEFAGSSTLLASAFQAGELEQRYSPVEVQMERQEIHAEGRSATVAGTVQATGAEPPPEVGVRVVALALDAAGDPAGYRVWESDRTDLLTSGLGFELLVASLGPPIAELVVLAEAR